MLRTWFVLVLAGLAATTAPGTASREAPSCSPSSAAAIVQDFTRAFAARAPVVAAASFAAENGIDDVAVDSRDDGELGFQWYSVSDLAGRRTQVAATNRESLERYFTRRVNRHERIRLLTIEVGRSWVPKGDAFTFFAARSADDLPRKPGYLRVAFGKGELNCDSRTISTISLGATTSTRVRNGAPTPPKGFRWSCAVPAHWRGVTVVCARRQP